MEIMYYVMDAHSFYNFIYFILLIIVSVRGAGALRASSRTHGPGGQAGGLWESLRGSSEPGSLGGRERGRGSNFVNAAQQPLIEGSCQGRCWKHPSLPIVFISHSGI